MLAIVRTSVIFLTCLPLTGIAVADGAARGEFRVAASLPEVIGKDGAGRFESIVDPAETIEWELFVPEAYDPERPPGLLVYISPSDSGVIPEGWQAVLEHANLVWIAANDSGNRVRVARRVTYAMVAPAVVARDYRIDASRVYVSGFSGGGRVASMVAPEYAHVFQGALYICGVNAWGDHTPPRLDAVRENRYVFLTGRKDFNRVETRRAYRAYRRAGVDNVLLMDVPGMDHRNPSPRRLQEALDFLDGR